MIRLRQKDIERLAIITGGPVDYLTKLVFMSLIDHNYEVDQLIKYSYKKLKSEKRYTLRRPITIFVCPLNDLSDIFCIFAS